MANKTRRNRKAEYAEKAERIKRLALIAMVSDDSLMTRLVLKGGNAMDLILEVGARASKDLDFSISGELLAGEIAGFRERVDGLLRKTFEPEGFTVIDVNFEVVPPADRATDPALFFWGGYQIDFKVIETKRAEELQGDPEKLRREAFRLGDGGSTKFSIEISKYEYCDPKEAKEIDGFRVYVYSPAMMVAEKLRAICQKTDEYAQIVRTKSQGERARDFLDIYVLMTKFNIKLTAPENLVLIKAVFATKKVPLEILARIEPYKERHKAGFGSVIASLKKGIKVRDFDFYFKFVVGRASELHSLWEI